MGLLERIQRGLAPSVRIDREIGSGGMGVVFGGFDVELDRPVAVKVLRPEAATAVAYERFVREARLIARSRHPNVIAVHQAGLVDGIPYYIMDLVAAETLAARLERGPLSPTEVRRVGHDVLAALGFVHGLGIIHRDIKPGNLFIEPDRALLADFGIARDLGAGGELLTATGAAPGTPAYMAPELLWGGEASVGSDLWAMGATLFEAATGQRYDPNASGLAPSLARLPRDLRVAIERAVAFDPKDRWGSAAELARALEPVAFVRRHRVALVAAGIAAVAALAVALRWVPFRNRSEPPTVVVSRVPGASPAADSLRQWLLTGLSGFPDFRVAEVASSSGRTIRLEHVLTGDPAGLRLGAALAEGGRSTDLGRWTGPARDWRRLGDSVIDAVVVAMLSGRGGGDRWLPRDALPRSTEGLRGLLRAERLYGAAQWDDAAVAYASAERLDSTCALCSYRLDDVDRWLDRPHDPARTARLLAAIDRFPPPYRALIRATSAPLPERLDSLRAATRAYWDFYLPWYRYGDELFHRGALFGHRRAEAIEAFRTAVRLRPDFAPVWAHLAWVAVAEGDSATAAGALERLHAWERPTAPIDLAEQVLVEAGFAWRFTPNGAAVTSRFLADPKVAAAGPLAAAPRLFPTFEMPEATVWLGARFAGSTEAPELQRSGLIALTLGRLALGQRDSALLAASRLGSVASDPGTRAFGLGVGAALALALGDPIDGTTARELAVPLLASLEPGARPDRERHAAGFLVAMLGIAAGVDSLAEAGGRALANEPVPGSFGRIVTASRLAARQRFDSAAAIAGIGLADSAAIRSSPFLRAVASLARARWLIRAGRPATAETLLSFPENSDLGFPTGEPAAAEFDWAVAPIAGWLAAGLLERSGRPTSACAEYERVWRFWGAGDRPFGLRADSATQARVRLKCDGGKPAVGNRVK